MDTIPFSRPHQTGCITGEPNEVYHADPAISCSKIKVFGKRPRLYKAQYIDKTYQPPKTAALEVGSALHDLVLLPDEFKARYAVAPQCDRRTSAGKDAWAAFSAANEGKTILKAEDAEVVERMARGIMDHPDAAEILSGGLPEVSWRTLPITNLPVGLQCRTDHIQAKDGQSLIVTDIKTVESIERFQKSIIDYGYHLQAGFYCLTITLALGGEVTIDSIREHVKEWQFIVVEKSEPFEAAVFKLSPPAIEKGAIEAMDYIMRLADCYANNAWPLAYPGIQTIDLPRWYYTKEEQ